jgi:aminopeptidase S
MTSSGTKQLGTTVSGVNDLVTGPLAGASAGDYDIDGGVTRI